MNMDGLTAVCDLTPEQSAGIGRLLAEHPVLRLYFAAALAAGGRDRAAFLTSAGTGACLSIDFDSQTIRTTYGDLNDAALNRLAALPRRGELHLTADHAARVRAGLTGRIGRERGLRYYHRDGLNIAPADPRCRRLTMADAELVAAFFAAHYPQTIFSGWMLEGPFLGLVEGSELLACGGLVVAADGIGNIGNFLTHPAHRGRGLAGVVVANLLSVLAAEGIGAATLGTNDDNPAACRLYERLGFACLERRVQFDLTEDARRG